MPKNKDRKASRNLTMFFYGLETLMVAALFGMFSFYVIYRRIAGEVPLYAYLWNLIFIATVLLLEKLADKIILSERFVVSQHTRPYKAALTKVLYLTHTISFKTALYVYYILILLLSRAAMLDPSVISAYMRSYLFSVEYVVLLLIPFDKLLEQILKDDKRTKKIYAKLMVRKEAEE